MEREKSPGWFANEVFVYALIVALLFVVMVGLAVTAFLVQQSGRRPEYVVGGAIFVLLESAWFAKLRFDKNLSSKAKASIRGNMRNLLLYATFLAGVIHFRP